MPVRRKATYKRWDVCFPRSLFAANLLILTLVLNVVLGNQASMGRHFVTGLERAQELYQSLLHRLGII